MYITISITGNYLLIWTIKFPKLEFNVYPVKPLINVPFWYFSTKRREVYKEFIDFADGEPLEILKHTTTRWLSLQRCLQRLLHYWPALKNYFSSHDDVEKDGMAKRVAAWLFDPQMKLSCHFLTLILDILKEFSTTFQVQSVSNMCLQYITHL